MAALAAVLVTAACSPPARYVLVADRSEVDFSNGGQRFICLTATEASRLQGMLALYSERDIRRYERTRRDNGDPLEEIFFHLVRSEYAAAGSFLGKHGRSVPEGLRLLLQADIAYETGTDVPVERLSALYQQAFEKQACELNRDLILLRIRQMRYGR
jgi:hypothetical protein